MKKISSKPPFIVFGFGALMSALILYFLLERERGELEIEILRNSEELRSSIQEEFLKTKSFLRGIEGLFYSSGLVTRAEFHSFCKSYISEQSPIQIVEWQPKVLSEERALFEERAQQDGLSNFHFFEIDELGREVPAKEREVHFPVFYTFSPEEGVNTVGLDLAFSPLRMKSKYQSMKIGGPVASETFGVIVRNSHERRLGMAYSYPVFLDGSVKSSQNLEKLKGFLAIVIDLEKVFAPIVASSKFKNLKFEVNDEGDNDKTIFSSITRKEEVAENPYYLSLELDGRSWGLYIYPKLEYFHSIDNFFPWLIFCLFLLISFGLSYYLNLKNVNLIRIRGYERQLEQKERLESIGLLASGVAHEFNNILQGIILTNENLKDNIDLSSFEHEYIDITLDLSHRGRDLVYQILSFARREAEGEEIEILPSRVIQDNIRKLQTNLGLDIDIKLDIETSKDRPLLMVSHHLEQILSNLCNNAIDAISGKGLIEITYQVEKNQRVLMVKDNGIGMNEEFCRKVFDPFYTTKKVGEGSGLGLFIVYGIVKSYHGEINVKSSPGKGALFTIILPG